MKCRLDGYHIGIAKCIHSITQDHTDTELPSRFPRPFYNWPLPSAEGEGAVCNEVSCKRRSAKFLLLVKHAY